MSFITHGGKPFRRVWNGVEFRVDSMFGAYGARAKTREPAEYRARMIRDIGDRVRITLEDYDGGKQWFVWRSVTRRRS